MKPLPHYCETSRCFAMLPSDPNDFGTAWERGITFSVPILVPGNTVRDIFEAEKVPCDLWNPPKRAPDHHLAKSQEFPIVFLSYWSHC